MGDLGGRATPLSNSLNGSLMGKLRHFLCENGVALLEAGHSWSVELGMLLEEVFSEDGVPVLDARSVT